MSWKVDSILHGEYGAISVIWTDGFYVVFRPCTRRIA